MAYANRWSITFKDFSNTTCTIYIQQDGWSGGVTALTPGNNPMIWEEDNSEDLTKRVRGKTGRIEVIEDNYGDLKDLYPTTPMQNRVVCNGVFWGYIKAQNSTNGWEAGPRTLKLNILSPLAMAYDIPMPINTTLGLREMGSVMADIMNTIGYTRLTLPVGTSTNKGDFFRGQIRGMLICPYANDKDYHYANDNEIFAPISIGELLEYICERHDLIAHDVPFSEQPQLLLTRMTLPGIYYQWSYANISGGNYDTASAYNYGNTEKNLLTEFTVADDNNTEQLVLPYSTIDVTHEGERGDSIKAPTDQSLYVEETVAYFNLTPRGIWLTNKDQCVRLHGENIKKVGSEGHNADDWENVDVLDINPNSILASGSLAFSITFYNVDRAKAYQLFFKYSHRDEGLHDSLYISARDKNGWFQLSHAAADVRPANVYPTSNSEVKMNVALNGGQYGEESYESTIRCGMVPEEYITINFYVGAQDLQRLKLYDIRLEATNAINGGLWAKYADQRFVERYPPWSTGEKKILNHALHLNNTFFSNYYETDFGFSNEIPYYLINSQRRIRVTVRAGSLSMFWYMYKYYIEGQTAKWKIIAISYNVRNKTYTLTLHYNSDF